MLRKHSFIHIILFVYTLLLPISGIAQDFSYVYIQGDKQTPFYVKFEDEMLPRYGKNYCIIPMLAPGPIHIEVLFQQNKYPAQKFTIAVPEGGFRGFLLKQNQGSFSLYDIQQKFYIHANNSVEDDQVPFTNGQIYTPPTRTPVKQPTTPPATVAKTEEKTPVKPNKTSEGSPKFIANIQLNNNGTGNTTPTKPKTNTTAEKPTYTYYRPPSKEVQPTDNKPVAKKPTGVLHNSDCPTAISTNEFDGIYDKASSRSDKTRLKYLLSEMDKCYTTLQAKTLALTLSNDPERYTFLKRVYPRVTNQAAFPPLENILSTNEWKDYFKLILPQ